MKKCILFFFVSLIFFVNVNAQSLSIENTKSSFLEWNFGIAYIEDLDFILDKGGLFPGTSVLYGMTFVNKSNIVYEFEVGIAFPSLLTGKLGIGKRFNNNIDVILGIRPFPSNIYIQSSLPVRKKGYFIISAEYNPFKQDNFLSVWAGAIFNVGYRWNLKPRKKSIE